MRTPWKFLSDLVSRTVPKDPRPAQASVIKDIEHHPAAEDEIAGVAAYRSTDPAESGAGEQTVKSIAGVHDTEIAKEDGQGGYAAPVPKEATQPQLIVKKTIFQEMTELDEEIVQLRRLLAHKLVAQNAQLRKMLERYGP